eukprot:gnl/TRDRNA2_/TRDRNA2_62826_c0_seq1.p1 gnl/TRDRNA2_/TRDRNA2_62826_c0~~gnl/TRDRNA2_/TRDRNA2_62826_c0_seq1.p1  ORF type:complete len:131 (-),score=2.59 gnl/TRDRNA2_/TRDRNA2_62826_c0_seq1:150-542(-)
MVGLMRCAFTWTLAVKDRRSDTDLEHSVAIRGMYIYRRVYIYRHDFSLVVCSSGKSTCSRGQEDTGFRFEHSMASRAGSMLWMQFLISWIQKAAASLWRSSGGKNFKPVAFTCWKSQVLDYHRSLHRVTR